MAELRPAAEPGLTASVLLKRWRHVPIVDPERWQEDINAIVDSSL